MSWALIAAALLFAASASGASSAGAGLVERGRRLLQQGDVDGARAAFQAASDADPRDARAPYWLGLALAQQGAEPFSIEQAYRSSVARDPSFAPAHSELGRLLFGLRRTVEAQEQLEAALKLAPNLAEAHFELGRLFRQQNQHADALVELSRAAELAPRDARYRVELADAYAVAKKFGEAAVELRRANALRPGNATQWSHLGLAQLAANDEAGARRSFETAIRIDPTTYPALLALARLELSHARPAAAVPLLDQARLFAPPDSPATAMLCEALATAKDRPDWSARALDECRAAAQSRPQDPAVQLYFLRQLVAQHDCSAAHAQLAVLEAIPLPPRESKWVQGGRAANAACTAASAASAPSPSTPASPKR